MACLYADGKLAPEQIWRQQSITGSIFAGKVTIVDNKNIPTISGQAFITMDSTAVAQTHDPLRDGF